MLCMTIYKQLMFGKPLLYLFLELLPKWLFLYGTKALQELYEFVFVNASLKTDQRVPFTNNFQTLNINSKRIISCADDLPL